MCLEDLAAFIFSMGQE